MSMEPIRLNPIGIVQSEINRGMDMPIDGVQAKIEILPEYQDALHRIEEYSHLWILSWFHQAQRDQLRAVPRKVNPLSEEFGVFALRSPIRPNPIALTLVKLEKTEGNLLTVSGLDAIDGTPVLDIKRYHEHDIVTAFHSPEIIIKRP